MRQQIKTNTYFEDFITFQKESISIFKEDFKEFHEKWNDEAIESLHFDLFRYQLNLFVAEYTSGLPVSYLKNNLSDIITNFSKCWKQDSSYAQILWLLSISICLEIEDETFYQLVALVDKDGLKDQLLDYLISFRIPNRKINDKLQFPKPYASLISATTWGKSIAQATLKTYLEKKWYPAHSDCGWHDSHKSPHNTYFGYWSFETAAIVKIMELDDSSFKDNQYYPYDLVHWKD